MAYTELVRLLQIWLAWLLAFFFCIAAPAQAMSTSKALANPLATKLDTHYFPINNTDPDGLLERDKNGKVIFTPVGPSGQVRHPSGAIGNVQPGYVKTDKGAQVPAFKNVDPTAPGWNTDCHGRTFADCDVWINDPEVDQILADDGWQKVQPTNSVMLHGKPKVGDIAIYREGGNVVHSVTVKKVDPKTGNVTVFGEGGLEVTPHSNPVGPGPGGGWANPSATYDYYRKTPKTP